jgi:hypothetical protein
MTWRDPVIFVGAGWALAIVIGVLSESLYLALIAGFLGSFWFLMGALYGYDAGKADYAGDGYPTPEDPDA